MSRFVVQVLMSLLLLSCASGARPLTTIPVRPDGSLMVVPVVVNGSRQWFMWDTGTPSLVIDPRLVAELKLPVLKKDSITGTGSGPVAMSHAAAVTMQLGSERYTAADPWVIDLSGVPIAKDVRGLVGADLWSRYAVRMNSQKKTLELFRAGSYRPASDEVTLPLIVANNKMYVDVTLDVKPGLHRTERLRVDTGSEESVNARIVGEALEVRRSILGNGLGQNFEAVSGRLQAVHIGPFTIRDVWGPGGKGPAIGMEMLRRFVVTFDAQAGKLYLEPTPALSEPVPPPPGG
jgi:hypothetical protein